MRAGYCGESDGVRIAWAGRHFGEEPPLTVWGGSGAIFFTGCALACPFCQNWQLSHAGMGCAVDCDEFVRICLRLQEAGAENINLVTAGHHTPHVAEYLRAAKQAGLTLPVVWNSSAYESIQTLQLLVDVVDVWLPDFKTASPSVARRLFAAPDYPSVAKRAIEWMVTHSPLEVHDVARGSDVREKITRGVIVRHLALPGLIDETIEALQWLKDNVDARAGVSLMCQYTPTKGAGRAGFQSLDRTLNGEEMGTLDDLVAAFDFQLLYKQEAGCQEELLMPDFSTPHAFPPTLATPVWHWREGFVAQQP